MSRSVQGIVHLSNNIFDHADFSDDHACMWRTIVTLSGVITNYLCETTQFAKQIISKKIYGHWLEIVLSQFLNAYYRIHWT